MTTSCYIGFGIIKYPKTSTDESAFIKNGQRQHVFKLICVALIYFKVGKILW